MSSIGTIRVQIAALEAAAGMISVTGTTAQDAQAQGRAAGAAGMGAFGGEPAGAAFEGMCARAGDALAAISNTTSELATNTASAAQGYHTTDVGVIPSSWRIGYGYWLFGRRP